jgi:hypothetical protein
MSNYCTYCLAPKEEVQSLTPVYDWFTGKLSGYFCEVHLGPVQSFQWKQEQAYKDQQKRLNNGKWITDQE